MLFVFINGMSCWIYAGFAKCLKTETPDSTLIFLHNSVHCEHISILDDKMSRI